MDMQTGIVLDTDFISSEMLHFVSTIPILMKRKLAILCTINNYTHVVFNITVIVDYFTKLIACH